jgi:hypothetical protein
MHCRVPRENGTRYLSSRGLSSQRSGVNDGRLQEVEWGCMNEHSGHAARCAGRDSIASDHLLNLDIGCHVRIQSLRDPLRQRLHQRQDPWHRFRHVPHCAANNTRIMKAGIKVLCLNSVVVPRKSLPASIHLSREVAQQRVHSNHLPPYMHTTRHRRESQIDRHDFPIFLKLLKPPEPSLTPSRSPAAITWPFPC